MGVLESGEAFLDETLRQVASEEVEYRPSGTGASIVLPAVIGNTFFSFTDVNGVDVKSRAIDFIVLSSDLGMEPQRGDVIIRKGQEFEVFSPNNEPCWNYSGGAFDSLRIHTHATGDMPWRQA